ncbi:MAG: PepSY-like domain-containing protein [Bacteroidia bacterium]|jgi:hypothetical protein|nr:PepSY-like domain-containing protein [Bacteroidia bacterium]
MKRVKLVAAAAMITSLAWAQKINEKEVPIAVKNALHQKYPDAKEVKWEKENQYIEAEFDVKKADVSVLFDDQGNIIETEQEIEINELPKGVVDYVKSHYKQNIKEAAKITDAKGTVTYEAEIKGMDLIFDSNGKFLKEIKEK